MLEKYVELLPELLAAFAQAATMRDTGLSAAVLLGAARGASANAPNELVIGTSAGPYLTLEAQR